MSIIKHVTLQKIVAHDFLYDLRSFPSEVLRLPLLPLLNFAADIIKPVTEIFEKLIADANWPPSLWVSIQHSDL